MANTNAPLMPGKLTAEQAERLAAAYRPAWELDDAPFGQGSALTMSDVDALRGGSVDIELFSDFAGPDPQPRKRLDSSDGFIEPELTPPPAKSRPNAPKARATKPPTPKPATVASGDAKMVSPAPTARAAQTDATEQMRAVKSSGVGVYVGMGVFAAVALAGVLWFTRAPTPSAQVPPPSAPAIAHTAEPAAPVPATAAPPAPQPSVAAEPAATAATPTAEPVVAEVAPTAPAPPAVPITVKPAPAPAVPIVAKPVTTKPPAVPFVAKPVITKPPAAAVKPAAPTPPVVTKPAQKPKGTGIVKDAPF
jgi:hypothetical protein